MFSVDNNRNQNHVKNQKRKNINKVNLFFSKKNIIISIGILIFIGLIYLLLFTNTFSKSSVFNEVVYQNPSDLYNKENNAIPYINLKGDNIDYLNNIILEDSLEILSEEDNIVGYSYYDNTEILSVTVKNILYRKEFDYPNFDYVTYNIDKNNSTILSNEELLNRFNFTMNDVETSIENGFLSYYDQVVEEGYLNKEQCDYECFLSWRDVDNYTDNIQFFVLSNSLFVYRTFNIYSVFGEEEFFADYDFLFSIYRSEF